jgi:glycosyltransferase involved in cell wall biosynthesis
MHERAITFIIPAYNEEISLPKVLESIVRHMPPTLAYEIIVADNGSQDGTVKVAKSFDVIVFVDDMATVGGLRNRAADIATGRVLVFLDADIQLTPSWAKNIQRVYQSLIENPWQVTGSRCGIPASESWIEKYWFKPLLEIEAKYINSGHLITTRELFNRLGGFDDQLESGEDYAFGMSAAAANALVINNPSLVVVHEGYPKTLLQFIRREIWHGRGDCKSLKSIIKSKVAIASIAFASLNICSLVILLFSNHLLLGASGFILAGILCVAFSIYKHGACSFKSIIVVSALFYLYLFSRFMSCVIATNGDAARNASRSHR